MRRALLGLLLLLAGGGSAAGHAVLVGSSPADGAVLDASPAELVLDFNEPVVPTAVTLTTPDGAAVALDPVQEPPGRLTMAAPALGAGTHLLGWRLVSIDGHPVTGTVAFSIGAASAAVAAPGERGWLVALSVARALVYLGVLVGAGAAFSGGTERRLALGVTLAGMAALVTAFTIQATILGGLDAAFAGRFGLACGVRLLGLGLAALGFAFGWRPVAVAGALVTAASFGLIGHGASREPWWLLPPLVAAHVAIAMFWAGALLPLRRAALAGDFAPVARFSEIASVLVPVLIVAGLLLAWFLVGTPDRLVTTAYGLALLAKVAVVAGLLALAAFNRLRLQRSRLLARSIEIELALVVAIAAATATLTSFAAPHQPAPTVRASALAGDIAIEIAVAAGNVVEVALTGPDGRPRDVVEIELAFANPALGAEIERVPERIGAGRYRYRGRELAVAGDWQVTVTLLVSDFERRQATVTLAISP